MASNLDLSQSNTLVATTVPINDVISNLNIIQANFQAIQTQFNALNAEVAQGVDVGGQQHFTNVTYDATNEVLTFTRQNNNTLDVNIGAAPTTPRLSELILTDINSNIDDSTSLVGDHTLTYHVSSAGLINSLSLIVNSTTIHTLTVPASDGRQSVTFNISTSEWNEIIATTPPTLAFFLQGEDTSSNEVSSNTVTVTRTSDSNILFYGLSDSNNPASVATTSLQSHVIQGSGTTVDVTIGPTTAGQFIIILAPQTHPVTAIRNTSFGNVDVLNTFTETENVRVIDAQAFDSYVFGPVNANLTARYEISLQ